MYHFSFRDIVENNIKNNTNSNTVSDNSNNKCVEVVAIIMMIISNMINTFCYS